jgi:hypothetical protein
MSGSFCASGVTDRMAGPDSRLLESWESGARAFNEGRYWDSHEEWERGWLGLEPALRLHVQGMIQSAAAFHLLGQGRLGPAQSLVASALEKFRLSDEAGGAGCPRIEIPGLSALLGELGREIGARGQSPGLAEDSEGARRAAFSALERVRAVALVARVVTLPGAPCRT